MTPLELDVAKFPGASLPSQSSSIHAAFQFLSSVPAWVCFQKRAPSQRRARSGRTADYADSIRIDVKLKVADVKQNNLQVAVKSVEARHFLGQYYELRQTFNHLTRLQISCMPQDCDAVSGKRTRRPGVFHPENPKQDERSLDLNFIRSFDYIPPCGFFDRWFGGEKIVAPAIRCCHTTPRSLSSMNNGAMHAVGGVHIIVDLFFDEIVSGHTSEKCMKVCRLAIFLTGSDISNDLNALKGAKVTQVHRNGTLSLSVDGEGFLSVRLLFRADTFDDHAEALNSTRKVFRESTERYEYVSFEPIFWPDCPDTKLFSA